MGRSIRFLDLEGQWWEAHEATSLSSLADVPVRRSGRLYFFSGRTTLKLEQYPSDWDRLSQSVLQELRSRAIPVSSFSKKALRDAVVGETVPRERTVQARL